MSKITECELKIIEEKRSLVPNTTWYVEECFVKDCWCRTIGTVLGSDSMEHCILPAGTCRADVAEYIAHIHNIMPNLIEHIRSLEEKLKGLNDGNV